MTRKDGLLLLLSPSSDLLTCFSWLEAGSLRDSQYLVDESCGDLFVGVSVEGDDEVGEGEDMQSFSRQTKKPTLRTQQRRSWEQVKGGELKREPSSSACLLLLLLPFWKC